VSLCDGQGKKMGQRKFAHGGTGLADLQRNRQKPALTLCPFVGISHRHAGTGRDKPLEGCPVSPCYPREDDVMVARGGTS
jgi:hypothetical protein